MCIVALAPALATAEIDLLLAQRSPDILHIDIAQGLGDQWPVPTRKARGRWLVEHRANTIVGPFAVDRWCAATPQVLEPVQALAEQSAHAKG